MKTLYKILLSTVFLLGVFSCDEENDFDFLTPVTNFNIIAPSSNTSVVIDRTHEDNPALTVSWKDDIGTAPYTVEFDLGGAGFTTPQIASTTDLKSVTWTVLELNTFLTETLGLSFNTEQDVDLRVVSSEGNISDPIKLTITPYGLEPLPKMAVAGNHQGWNPSEAEVDFVPYIATPLPIEGDPIPSNYEGYMWLDGGFKFVEPNDAGEFAWGNTDWGDDGSFAGLMASEGEINFPDQPAGYYYITADTGTLVYNVVAVNWGIIGEATPGGWGADTDLIYNPDTKALEADMDLTPGAYKFRGNDDWGPFDLGTINEDGFLQNGGDLTFDGSAGNYHVVLDLSNPRRYTITFTQN